MGIFVVAVIGPVIANQSGWVAAEVGRQPWIVWGLLRTSDALSVSVKGEEVLASITMFALIYALLALVWIYVLDSKIKHGPDTPADRPAPNESAGLMAAAAALGDPSGVSLTGARDAAEQTESQE
jgi:cytochrome bd-type quinol oxidase subunit 1